MPRARASRIEVGSRVLARVVGSNLPRGQAVIEDQFAWALIATLLVTLRLHALDVIAFRESLPEMRTIRAGDRLCRFMALRSLRATLEARFSSIQTTHAKWSNDRTLGLYVPKSYSRTVPMPERPDSRLC